MKKILIGLGVVVAAYLIYRFVVKPRLMNSNPPVSGAVSGPSAGASPRGAIQANFSGLKQTATTGSQAISKFFNPSFKPFGAK